VDNVRFGWSLAILLLPAAPSAWAQDRAAIEAGAALYSEHCATCHGERMVNPGSAFDLRKLTAAERPRFETAVNDGKGQMPAWGGQFTPEEIDQLWAYIRSRANS
jgi:mono/diheme cytochrome c family protein